MLQARRSGFMGALVYPMPNMSTHVVRQGIMLWNKRARQVGAGQLFQLTDKPYMADVYIEGDQDLPGHVAGQGITPMEPEWGSPPDLAQFRPNEDPPHGRINTDDKLRFADKIWIDEKWDTRAKEYWYDKTNMRTIPPSEERIAEIMKEYPWVNRQEAIDYYSTEVPSSYDIRTVPVKREDETFPPSLVAHELGHTQGLKHKQHAVTPGIMRYGPESLGGDQRAAQHTTKPTQQEARQVARNQGQSTTPSKGPKNDKRPISTPKKEPGKRVVTGVGKVKQ